MLRFNSSTLWGSWTFWCLTPRCFGFAFDSSSFPEDQALSAIPDASYEDIDRFPSAPWLTICVSGVSVLASRTSWFPKIVQFPAGLIIDLWTEVAATFRQWLKNEKKIQDMSDTTYQSYRCLGILDGKDGPSDRTKLEVVKSVGCTSHCEDEEAETSVKAYALAKLPWHSIGISWNPWKTLIKRLSWMILYTATMLWVIISISYRIYTLNNVILLWW